MVGRRPDVIGIRRENFAFVIPLISYTGPDDPGKIPLKNFSFSVFTFIPISIILRIRDNIIK